MAGCVGKGIEAEKAMLAAMDDKGSPVGGLRGHAMINGIRG